MKFIYCFCYSASRFVVFYNRVLNNHVVKRAMSSAKETRSSRRGSASRSPFPAAKADIQEWRVVAPLRGALPRSRLPVTTTPSNDVSRVPDEDGLTTRAASAIAEFFLPPNAVFTCNYPTVLLHFVPLSLMHAMRNPLLLYQLAMVMVASIPGVVPVSTVAVALPLIVCVVCWMWIEWIRDGPRRFADAEDNDAPAVVARLEKEQEAGKTEKGTDGGERVPLHTEMMKRSSIRLGDILELREGDLVGADCVLLAMEQVHRQQARRTQGEPTATADDTGDDDDSGDAESSSTTLSPRTSGTRTIIVDARGCSLRGQARMERRIQSFKQLDIVPNIRGPSEPFAAGHGEEDGDVTVRRTQYFLKSADDIFLRIRDVEVPFPQRGDEPKDWRATVRLQDPPGPAAVASAKKQPKPQPEPTPILGPRGGYYDDIKRASQERKSRGGGSAADRLDDDRQAEPWTPPPAASKEGGSRLVLTRRGHQLSEACLLTRGMRIVQCRRGRVWALCVGIGSDTFFAREFGHRKRKLADSDWWMLSILGLLAAGHHAMLFALAFFVGNTTQHIWMSHWYVSPHFERGGISALPIWIVAYAVNFVFASPVFPIFPLCVRLAQVMQAYFMGHDPQMLWCDAPASDVSTAANGMAARPQRALPSNHTVGLPGLPRGAEVLRLDTLLDFRQTGTIVIDKTGPITSPHPSIDVLYALGAVANLSDASSSLHLELRGANRPKLAQLCTAMALCSSTFPIDHRSELVADDERRRRLPDEGFRVPSYESEREDDVALVRLAAEHGFVLADRNEDGVRLFLPAWRTSVQYEVIAEQRYSMQCPMLVLVLRETVSGDIVCFARGSWEPIWPLLASERTSRAVPHVSRTLAELRANEEAGSKCVMYASKRLDANEWEATVNHYRHRDGDGIGGGGELLESDIVRVMTDDMLPLGFVATTDVLQPGAASLLSFVAREDRGLWIVSGDHTKVTAMAMVGAFSQSGGAAALPGSFHGPPVLLWLDGEEAEEGSASSSSRASTEPTTEEMKRAKLKLALQKASRELIETSRVGRPSVIACIRGPSITLAGEHFPDLLDDVVAAVQFGCCGACGSEAKRDLVMSLQRTQGRVRPYADPMLPLLHATIAIGDGFADVEMMQAAAVGVGILETTSSKRVMRALADLCCPNLVGVVQCITVHAVQVSERLDFAVRVTASYGLTQGILEWIHSLWMAAGTTPGVDPWITAATTLAVFLATLLCTATDGGLTPLSLRERTPRKYLPRFKQPLTRVWISAVDVLTSVALQVAIIAAAVAPLRDCSVACGYALGDGTLGVLVQGLVLITSLSACVVRVRSWVILLLPGLALCVCVWLLIVGIYTAVAIDSTAFLAARELGSCSAAWGALAFVTLVGLPVDAGIAWTVRRWSGEAFFVDRFVRLDSSRQVLVDIIAAQDDLALSRGMRQP